MRGTACLSIRQSFRVRFIPACAGNRSPDRTSPAASAVHPRVCGEQFDCIRGHIDLSGSSPRVRGTDPHRTPTRPIRRFIPACAGNRIAGHAEHRQAMVHPRVCGEQGTLNFDPLPFDGSSPRVRGTGSERRTSRRCCRFIPACAGNRLPKPLTLEISTVHPRVCGEQVDRH